MFSTLKNLCHQQIYKLWLHMCQLLNDVIVGRLQGAATVCGCYGVLGGG